MGAPSSEMQLIAIVMVGQWDILIFIRAARHQFATPEVSPKIFAENIFGRFSTQEILNLRYLPQNVQQG